jgi:hypothetical protein
MTLHCLADNQIADRRNVAIQSLGNKETFQTLHTYVCNLKNDQFSNTSDGCQVGTLQYSQVKNVDFFLFSVIRMILKSRYFWSWIYIEGFSYLLSQIPKDNNSSCYCRLQQPHYCSAKELLIRSFYHVLCVPSCQRILEACNQTQCEPDRSNFRLGIGHLLNDT